MREDFEDKTPDTKRYLDEEELYEDTSAGRVLEQSLDTLRQGFSWIAHFQRQHPGYEFVSYEEEIPFLTSVPSLPEARVALVSTAGVYLEGQKPFSVSPEPVTDDLVPKKFREMGDPSFRLIPSDADPRAFWVAHPYLDHHGVEEDINVVFPITRLLELEEESFIAGVAAQHLSFMGYLPHPDDIHRHLGEAIEELRRNETNVVVLTPGEVLSHQTAAILQRTLEEEGFATVSITLCRDITQHVGVPRAVHVRFPFGYTLGEPKDDAQQLRILKDALRALAEVETPGTILDLPYEWVAE